MGIFAGKWHPASGDWGVFKTSGRTAADEARARLSSQASEIASRKEGIGDYFSGLRGFNEREGELAELGRGIQRGQEIGQIESSRQQYLSGLENFLSSSYSIGSESDARVSQANLANSFNPQEQFALRQRRSGVEAQQDAQKSQDQAMARGMMSSDLAYRQQQVGGDRADLQLGMEETKAQQALRDQLFQLSEALAQY